MGNSKGMSLVALIITIIIALVLIVVTTQIVYTAGLIPFKSNNTNNTTNKIEENTTEINNQTEVNTVENTEDTQAVSQ